MAALPFAGGEPQQLYSQPINTTPAVEAAAPEPTAAEPAMAEPTSGTDIVDAPAQPISTTKPLPPAVKPTAPVAEVLKLADSGVEESVLLAFVTNSTSTFNLGAEEIIYLNDIGVPSAVVTAMIQRDLALKASLAYSGPGPAAPMPTPAESATAAPEPPPVLAPTDMAPQPDNTAGNYPPPDDTTTATFYDSLAPYGTWVDVGGYGACWQPTVVALDPGWQPYCNGGHWVYTDCGWYWLSGYSWGWAPFHYGRWFRHSHYGWCWRPGNTWGPSWVCWRYTGNYCGWAPLPPAAEFRAGVGLTFHGQNVHSSFGFGLGVNSYTFVPASQFPNRHLDHYALSRQQAAHVYNQTVPSTTIVGSGTRVVNEGIPVSHVATASRTQIHTIGIRDINAAAGARGVRGEQLEANSRTLSVFRPQFAHATGTQPAFGGRTPFGLRQRGGSPVAMPSPTAPQVAPVQSPRTGGGSHGTPPASSGGSGGRPQRSPNNANAAPITPTGAAPILARQTSDPASKAAQPKDAFSGRAEPQPRHPMIIAEAAVQSPAQPRWSTSGAAQPAVRSARAWQPVTTSYKAPAEVPRSAPSPSYAPPRAQSYSPPTPSPAARAEPTVSQPVHSTSSAPAASVSVSHSGSSSGRGWR